MGSPETDEAARLLERAIGRQVNATSFDPSLGADVAAAADAYRATLAEPETGLERTVRQLGEQGVSDVCGAIENE